VAEENSHSLSEAVAAAEGRLDAFERERHEHFEELNLQQTRGSELFLAIVSPPWVRITYQR
jgi:hypothetical protein